MRRPRLRSKEIDELRRREREAGPHTRASYFLRQRRSILELGLLCEQMLPMVYWSENSVPSDELEMVHDELIKTVAHMEKLLRCAPIKRTPIGSDRQLNAPTEES